MVASRLSHGLSDVLSFEQTKKLKNVLIDANKNEFLCKKLDNYTYMITLDEVLNRFFPEGLQAQSVLANKLRENTGKGKLSTEVREELISLLNSTYE